MSKTWMWAVLAAAALACAAQGSCRAEEGKPAKAARGAENKNEDKGFGDKFTSFWIHDVGGTIHNGLRKGTDKVQNTFTGGTKEKDVEKKRVKDAEKKKEEQEKEAKQKSEATKP